MQIEEISKKIKSNLYNSDKLSLFILVILDKKKIDITEMIEIFKKENETYNRTTIVKRLSSLKNMELIEIDYKETTNKKSKTKCFKHEYSLSEFGKMIVRS